MNMRGPRLTVNQGDQGSGKSALVARTAPRRPVHFFDIDTKLTSSGWAQPLLASGDVTVWMLAEPIDPSPFRAQLDGLSKELNKKGPISVPMGVTVLDEYLYSIKKHEDAMRAGSWCIDTATILNEHVKVRMMHQAGRSKFTFDQWVGLKMWWLDFMSRCRDMMRDYNKDIYINIHERFKEEPGDRTTGVAMTPVKHGDEISMEKQYQGTQDLKIWASIEGQTGDLIGCLADEYYHTFVDGTDKNAPKWRVRILPDGRRSLKTSMWTTQAIWDPDISKIWGERRERFQPDAVNIAPTDQEKA